MPIAGAIVLAGALSAAAQPGPPAPPQIVAVRLSSFSFAPNHLVFKAGVPVRLRLTNDSSGGHDFHAPEFFAASAFLPGSPRPGNGGVDLAGGQTVELTLLPRTPGHYEFRCTHFLHSFFGMNGTIDVTP